MLDRLRPAARSAVVLCVIAPLTALLGGFVAAVLQAGGVFGVEWGHTGATALDTAGVALATGIGTFITLYVTPLTARYGIGATTPPAADLRIPGGVDRRKGGYVDDPKDGV